MIGDGPPVVVVHGTPWSSFNLRYLIKELYQGFTVYYYDLIGYGQSDKTPGDVSLSIQNRMLDQLLDHWGLENPAIIGHDLFFRMKTSHKKANSADAKSRAAEWQRTNDYG